MPYLKKNGSVGVGNRLIQRKDADKKVPARSPQR